MLNFFNGRLSLATRLVLVSLLFLGSAIFPTALLVMQSDREVSFSEKERSWMSQVQEMTRVRVPFWIVGAGGKFDFTAKWWEHARWQAVVDDFAGRIRFVQVGEKGHHHPALRGVLDLRGKTDLRQLVRLVYHADGVLCPVTSLMHLAAAVPWKHSGGLRPCVVVAGVAPDLQALVDEGQGH